MIEHRKFTLPRPALAAALFFLIAALGVFVQPAHGGDTPDDPQAIATGVMQTWLKGIDDGGYEQSWKDASPDFQKAITSEGWVAACKKVRVPLGKCTGRMLASASRQTDLPSPKGKVTGDFILAQFDTSFEGLKYAVETVTFTKTPDGAWKAAGYYVKPK
jgi:hypothetical protein